MLSIKTGSSDLMHSPNALMDSSSCAVRVLVILYFFLNALVSFVVFLVLTWHAFIGLPFGEDYPFWIDLYRILETTSSVVLSLFACHFIIKNKSFHSNKIAIVFLINIIVATKNLVIYLHSNGLNFEYDHSKLLLVQIVFCSIMLVRSVQR
jgi:hypothetical protein